MIKKVGSAIEHYVRWLVISLAAISALALTVIMFTTVADTTRRYLFSKSLQSIVELNETLLILVIFCAIALAQLFRRHVRVELFTIRLSPKLQEFLWLISVLAGFVILLTMCIETMEDALYAYSIKEFKFGGGVAIFPIWWAKFAIPIGCFVLCLQFLVDTGRSIAGILGIIRLEQRGRARER